MKNVLPLVLPEQFKHYRSIDAYVVIPRPGFAQESQREIIERARHDAQQMVERKILGIPIHRAKPMTLEEYLPVFRESIIPEGVKDAESPFDHLFAPRPNDPFYAFVSEHLCLLDTQIEILEARKRRWKNCFRKDDHFQVRLWNHGEPIQEEFSLPAPRRGKEYGMWGAKYSVLVDTFGIADDLQITTRDPQNFQDDHFLNLQVTATDRCTHPKYSFLSATSPYAGSWRSLWAERFVSLSTSMDGSFGVGVPLVLYTRKPAPYRPRPWQTTTRDTFNALNAAAREAADATKRFLDSL